MALFVGVVDFQSHVDVIILYVLPIYIAAWYGGWRVGAVIAIYCSGASLITSLITSGFFHSDQSTPVAAAALWAFIARLLVYLGLVKLLSQLKQTMHMQSELTHFIVHDLRSPISSAITGLVTLQQMNDEMPADEKEMVSLALISNERALGLVNSILDVAKLQEGQMVVDKEPCKLEHLAEISSQQVELWAMTNEVEIVKEIKVESWLLDETLTSRVIVNLLSNALKFSSPQHKITLRMQLSGSGNLEVSVIDQGPGIPASYAEKIFEPFSQVAGTKGGTGLGLTFCRLAVHAQGGRIWVDSALGKGTAMRFTLPKAQA